ncbi:hypothetical protein [Azospirillum sp. SYSU D00513]|uniref:hypothetical protein n=1 Tax=Azospirillum sp. SYSU D00513 TaxID=2812561 RepID=UPI001A97BCD0|nr:hypothetical protein [Azospirillum sp. SYSU D00513]
MAEFAANQLSLSELLEPVLTVLEGDEVALDRAINEVAETLADCGTLMVDALGRPAHGVTDEQAILIVLDTYIRELLHFGDVEGAADLGDLMDTIHRFGRRRDRKRRGTRAA